MWIFYLLLCWYVICNFAKIAAEAMAGSWSCVLCIASTCVDEHQNSLEGKPQPWCCLEFRMRHLSIICLRAWSWHSLDSPSGVLQCCWFTHFLHFWCTVQFTQTNAFILIEGFNLYIFFLMACGFLNFINFIL